MHMKDATRQAASAAFEWQKLRRPPAAAPLVLISRGTPVKPTTSDSKAPPLVAVRGPEEYWGCDAAPRWGDTGLARPPITLPWSSIRCFGGRCRCPGLAPPRWGDTGWRWPPAALFARRGAPRCGERGRCPCIVVTSFKFAELLVPGQHAKHAKTNGADHTHRVLQYSHQSVPLLTPVF